MRVRARFFLGSVLLFACADQITDPQPPSSLVIPAGGALAFLSVSDPGARVGSTITVTAMVRQSDGSAVGAFTARLDYAAGGLEFIEEVPLSGGARALNPVDTTVFAAGASAEGFTDGRLFAARFRVLDRKAVTSFALSVTELSARNYENRVKALMVHPQLVSEGR